MAAAPPSIEMEPMGECSGRRTAYVKEAGAKRGRYSLASWETMKEAKSGGPSSLPIAATYQNARQHRPVSNGVTGAWG